MSTTAKRRRGPPDAATETCGTDTAPPPAPAEGDERLRAFATAAGLWLWETDHSLRFRFFSPGWRDVTGLEPVGLSPWEVWGRLEWDDQQWRLLRQGLEAGAPLEGVRLMVTARDGGRRCLEVRGQPYTDDDGRFGGYRGCIIDITAQVEAERRATAAQRVLIDAIESMPVGVVLWSPEGELMLSNTRYLDLVPPGARPQPDFCSPGEACELEVGGRWLQIRHHRMEEGCLVGIYSDVTELRAATEQAEQANRAKSRFLAAASHDIRQPLQAMGLFVAALGQSGLTAPARDLVAKLEASLESLESLLSSLLDISRLEAGVVEPQTGPVPLGPMLHRLAEEFAPLAHDKGVRLRAVPTAAVAHSDPVLLERILRNLLANAVRYTPAGGILLGCRRRGGRLRIEVRDTGVGIPPEHRQAIFREFHRLPGTRHGKGFGLGLAIVERTASLLGHEVDVQSREGRGSLFAVGVAPARGPRARRASPEGGTQSCVKRAESRPIPTKVDIE